MSFTKKSVLIISLACYYFGFYVGYNIRINKKEELEQKLCQLEQYEYCTKQQPK